MYLAQDLKQFLFWSYFLDVCLCFKPISFKLSSDVPSLLIVSAQKQLTGLDHPRTLLILQWEVGSWLI